MATLSFLCTQDLFFCRHLQQKYYMATEVRNNLIAASSNIVNAKRYLNNIRFPYCEPGEIATLQRACNNVYVDMRTPDRHQHAFQCYDVTFKRAAALLQWFDSVCRKSLFSLAYPYPTKWWPGMCPFICIYKLIWRTTYIHPFICMTIHTAII